MKVINLRTQNLNNPIGIQEVNPVLSWKLKADERNKFQSAYRIIAASSKENITKGNYDIWDSGKVISSKNYAISYAGKKLNSMDRVYWAVMVWDEKDIQTEYCNAIKKPCNDGTCKGMVYKISCGHYAYRYRI